MESSLANLHPIRIYVDDGFASTHGGGIGVYSEIIFSELKARGLDVRRGNGWLSIVRPRALRRALYLISLNLWVPLMLKLRKIDIAHFTNSLPPFWKNGRTKYVSTIHDLIPLMFPDTVPDSYVRYYHTVIKTTLKNADGIITCSKCTKNDLHTFFGISDETVQVCHIWSRQVNGAAASYCAENLLKSDSDYFLFVGRIERRKNIPVLLEAFDKFKHATGSRTQLVLVGAKGFGHEAILRQVAASESVADIVISGYVTDERLRALYRGARAFVFPPIYEGFGLPLIEAMQYQLPLILSDIPSNREVAGEHACYFERSDSDTLKELLVACDRSEAQKIDYSTTLGKYSLDIMIDAHLSAYHSFMDRQI